MRIVICVCAYKNAYIPIYAYTRMFISIYELAYCLSIVSELYCSKEKLDSTKKLNDYAATTSNMKTSSHAVASVYELDRKYVLINI